MNLKETGIKTIAAFGEIMMRLNCPVDRRFHNTNSFGVYFGGAEANVCVFLSGLGLPAKFITRLPENELAYAAIAQLRSYGVDVSGIQTGGNKLGLYFTENGNSIRSSQVIYYRNDSSFAGIQPGMINWDEILEGVNWLHWSGISAAVSQSAADICLEALQAAKQKGITISADMNYRSTLWDYGKHPSDIMPQLLGYADVIIGDIYAATIYFPQDNIEKINDELSTEAQFKNAAKILQQKLPGMKSLAMSFRNTNMYHQQLYTGALLYKDEFYFSPVYTIPVTTDRIGSGDAFTGGLIYALNNNSSPQDIIAFATASGVLKHSVAGDFAKLSANEIQHFINNGPVTRIIR